MRSPRISVIIPVYKAEKHLSAALESLLRQTDDRWEAICINDGSPDNSAAILNAYAAKDSRFHIIHQQNQGVSAARNTGISHAQGDIVTFLDADDWFSETLIEQLLCPFEVPDVDIVLFEASTEYEPGMPRQPGLEKDLLLPEGGERIAAPCYIQTVIGTCWAKAFRRNFLLCHQLTFPLGMRFEDEVFHRCSMAVARKVFFLKETGYHYRQTADSFMYSGVSAKERYRLYIKGAEIIYQYYLQNRCGKEWHETILAHLHTQLGRCEFACTKNELKELRRLTHAFLTRTQIPALFAGDRRLRYLAPQSAWKTLFLKQRPEGEIYSIFGIPLMKNRYINGTLECRVFPWNRMGALFKERLHP